jgi:hypothetical protein
MHPSDELELLAELERRQALERASEVGLHGIAIPAAPALDLEMRAILAPKPELESPHFP